ncbi:hypothetical protein [Nitrosovibrio sp. Nv6]|uniref:hypothetical protein n=1 Tax=Nitrosovibrio sp. Nv6 TaxID=1855340 RepID=UPI001314EC85|nr:hypothetical protein [Nitrosovibrio sp. Nv6]
MQRGLGRALPPAEAGGLNSKTEKWENRSQNRSISLAAVQNSSCRQIHFLIKSGEIEF